MSPKKSNTTDLPRCPKCHKTEGVKEEAPAGSSLRWFVCGLCFKVWYAAPKKV